VELNGLNLKILHWVGSKSRIYVQFVRCSISMDLTPEPYISGSPRRLLEFQHLVCPLVMS
jgi:hypothetical protein